MLLKPGSVEILCLALVRAAGSSGATGEHLQVTAEAGKHWYSRLIRLISLSAWKDLVYSHLTICYEAFSLSTVNQI